jgi:drug/metabolite transporter (DMT)-like permease
MRLEMAASANTPHQESRVGLAIALRLAAVANVAAMSALVKAATLAGANTGEVMFYRYALSMPFIAFWVATHGGLEAIKTKRPWGQITRAIIGLCSMTAMFLTVAYLPLPEATTFFFMAPLVATALSIIVLRETVGLHRWIAIAIGVVGMLVMIQPGAHQGLTGGGIALGLVSALFLALSTITLRQLGSTENPAVTVFWFTAIGTIATAAIIPFFFQSHDLKTWLLLAAAGLAGTGAQTLATSALRYAPVSVTAPFEYSQLLWATLFGWLIWSDLPALTTVIGAAFIGGAGLYTFYREHLRPRPGIAESTTIT